MSSNVYLRLRPTAGAFLLGEPADPDAFVVLDGERREAFAPLTAGDRDVISALARGNAVARDAPLVDWLLETELAAIQAEPAGGLPPNWPERWSRQLSEYCLFAGIDGALDVHAHVASSHVLVVGLGGIGCHVVQQLASIGVRRFTFVDPDHVEASNLNRQILYARDDVGDQKIDAARRFVESRWADGGDLDVTTRNTDFLDWQPTTDELDDVDLAVVSADDRPTRIRRRASDRFYHADVPYGFASYNGTRASIGPLVFRTDRGCGNCEVVRVPVEKALTPLQGPGVRSIPPSSAARNGLLAAGLVDRWLRSLVEASPPYSIVFDVRDLTSTRIEHQRLESCPVCGEGVR